MIFARDIAKPKTLTRVMMHLIELISNCCSNLNKLGTLVDLGLSQAHKKAHAHIWSKKVFFHKVYYSFS